MNFLNSHLFSSFNRIFTKQTFNCNAIINRNYNHSNKRIRQLKPTSLWPNKKKSFEEPGQKYFGFTYFPRYPDQKDPDWEPSPLFMVKRRKPNRKIPFWEKRILRNLRIEQDNNEVAILINSEHNNRTLWKIKHLIEIIPITFPDGIPTEKDIPYCEIHDNGELRIKKSLLIDPARLGATETFQKSIDTIDQPTVQKYTRQQWLNPYTNISKY